MKEFSHPGSEEKKSIDINKAIETTITVARNEWKYVAEIETHFDLDLPLVLCHAGEFNQVILNLLINAAQAIQAWEMVLREKERLWSPPRTTRTGPRSLFLIREQEYRRRCARGCLSRSSLPNRWAKEPARDWPWPIRPSSGGTEERYGSTRKWEKEPHSTFGCLWTIVGSVIMAKRILFVDDEPMVLSGLQRSLRPMRSEWEMVFAAGGDGSPGSDGPADISTSLLPTCECREWTERNCWKKCRNGRRKPCAWCYRGNRIGRPFCARSILLISLFPSLAKAKS